MSGRWAKYGAPEWVKLAHVVRDVNYREETDDFTVVVKDLENNVVLEEERFDYVVVSSGHYSTPHVPSFDGIDKFPGHVSHSHDFRWRPAKEK